MAIDREFGILALGSRPIEHKRGGGRRRLDLDQFPAVGRDRGHRADRRRTGAAYFDHMLSRLDRDFQRHARRHRLHPAVDFQSCAAAQLERPIQHQHGLRLPIGRHRLLLASHDRDIRRELIRRPLGDDMMQAGRALIFPRFVGDRT